jgi:hypothetical protein
VQVRVVTTNFDNLTMTIINKCIAFGVVWSYKRAYKVRVFINTSKHGHTAYITFTK